MSRIMYALERLDMAVGRLESSVEEAAVAEENNVVDVDFVAKRLDHAIAAVENLLEEQEVNNA